jgi:anti-sigma-K factor RskA
MHAMSGETQQSLPPDDLHTQAGEYVLGTLNANQRRSIESRLTYEPALRAAVDEWEQRLLPLTSLAEPIEPAAGLWQRIVASIAQPKLLKLQRQRFAGGSGTAFLYGAA